MNRILVDLCHVCDGSGKDDDAERAASPGRCYNCHGTGNEPPDPHIYEDLYDQ